MMACSVSKRHLEVNHNLSLASLLLWEEMEIGERPLEGTPLDVHDKDLNDEIYTH